jgi:hypothetical protein
MFYLGSNFYGNINLHKVAAYYNELSPINFSQFHEILRCKREVLILGSSFWCGVNIYNWQH